MSPFDESTLSRLCERHVEFLSTAESTNDLAVERAEAGASSGALVVADSQTGGRGRQGRSWHSPPGLNLYFSLVLRPPVGSHQAPLLGLACAVGLAEALALQIKWPNDLLDGTGRKVAGILSRVETVGSLVRYVVLGVGINVNQREFPADLPNAGSLAMGGEVRDRGEILARCVRAIEGCCAEVGPHSERVLERWRLRWAHGGRPVTVGGRSGVARDIRGDGALLVAFDDGVEPVLSGDVLPVNFGHGS